MEIFQKYVSQKILKTGGSRNSTEQHNLCVLIYPFLVTLTLTPTPTLRKDPNPPTLTLTAILI